MAKEKEEESNARSTDLQVTGGNGTGLTVHLGYDMDIFLDETNEQGENTEILVDFPSCTNGGGRHPYTMRALDRFGDPGLIRVSEKLPIQITTKDNVHGNILTISISSEREISLIIRGISSKSISSQTVEFTLSPQDEGFNPRVFSKFLNLAQAIQMDEANLRNT